VADLGGFAVVPGVGDQDGLGDLGTRQRWWFEPCWWRKPQPAAYPQDVTPSVEGEMTRTTVIGHLGLLIGKKLSVARRAADMRIFHFGPLLREENGLRLRGEFALHIQCPWRVDGPNGVVTGRADLWEPADQDQEIDLETWDYESDGNLQDHRLEELLGGFDPRANSFVNETEFLVVEEINADDIGAVSVALSGGYRLLLFPSGSVGEDWRFFEPSSDQDHLVVVGGAVEPLGDAG
jgi:hypothetical protein